MVSGAEGRIFTARIVPPSGPTLVQVLNPAAAGVGVDNAAKRMAAGIQSFQDAGMRFMVPSFQERGK
jgi:hypothetical protein